MTGPGRTRTTAHGDGSPTFTTIGAPIDSVGLGRAEPHGTELSPGAVRSSGLARLGWADHGDLDVRIPDHDRDPTTGLVGIDGVLATTDTLRAAIADLVRAGDRPFVLGGCCALLPGTLAGVRDVLGPVGLVYVDGHLDFYDGVTSPTGEAADMPIAVLLGDGPAPWAEGVAPTPVVPDQRDGDPRLPRPRRARRRRRPAPREARGRPVRRRRRHASRRPDRPPSAAPPSTMSRRSPTDLWLHIDLDVLDQDVFPATDYLMSGGLDWDELVALVTPVARDPRLAGWSLACYNPEKDPGGRDGRAIVAAMERIFGG